MSGFTFVGDLIEKNGKTVKENNLTVTHTIPIGTLVEVNCDYQGEHKTRQFIASHGRDCDGTPLYSLTTNREYCDDKIGKNESGIDRTPEEVEQRKRLYHNGGWGGDSLIVINDKEG